ncbi:MAG: orotate phosphoribosyltransferase [Polycyclovorans sp.]|jgi:orotate phosphoribosyltransferase|nr:orotate phosphoribosyltransferase [Polycyclovorans sp.]MBU0789704.1 orotate phosphoribosyltransferase [Gammaproteobacteria bacterium]MEC8850042.1 orotate phosphoribosyltransferase [Pseudomonadota bacterium]|tara:strand:- start:17567 stop:18214 length:648 start_codon:yes stop_codon:yes gene_type:complete
MQPHQRDFLDLALSHQVLRFGEFTLKSGRVSPYFFNLGQISSGAALMRLARAYARTLTDARLPFDALFGPAYKGIPLAAAVAIALAEQGRDVPFAYNRKEAKAHGEGGTLVGPDLSGKRVVLVDDVLTAGTALREAVGILRAAGARPVAALIALDRQEQGPVPGQSAVEAMTADTGVPVLSLVNVDQVLDFLAQDAGHESTRAAIRAYQGQYGVR